MYYDQGQKENSPKPLRVNNLPEAITALLEGSVSNIHLQRQNLTDNALLAFIQALSSNESLLYLDLRNNLLTDSTALALAKALKKHEYLTALYVAGNSFTQVGYKTLKDALNGEAINSDIDECLNPESVISRLPR